MRKKIKESIGAKTFLTMFLLLTVCCILIYGMVMVFLPKNYQVELQNQFTTDLYKLTESLEKVDGKIYRRISSHFLYETMRLCGLRTKREMKCLPLILATTKKRIMLPRH